MTLITALLAMGTLLGWWAAPARLTDEVHAQDRPLAGDAQYQFKGGFPTPRGSKEARDHADFERAVTAYRFWYPTVSCEGIFNGIRKNGINDNEGITILSAAPRHVIFTANSDTPYGSGTLDLKGGPYVVELPPGPFVGLADDHHQGWILDLGLAGPDAGKGGKHQLLPPGYKGDIPKGYFVGKSSSYKVLIAVRSLPPRGDLKGAIKALREIKVYPLATADNPKLLKFVDGGDKAMDATCLRWEDNLKFWEKLHEVIAAEPVVNKCRPMYGLLSALGIEKGKPFAPDARLKAILETAAKVGRDQMLVSAFASARPDRFAWKDRQWEWIGLVPGSAQFETKAGMDLEARDRWFIQAIVTSPAMFRRTKGAGSLYWLGHRDNTGAFVDGGKTYRLTVPQPVPANLFWSVTIYDAATRSQVQAAQGKAALRSLFELKDRGGDRSLDLYFGPKAPSGKEGQWIQTVPGRGWFAYFRIYGPQEAAFDGSWKPGDFEEMKSESSTSNKVPAKLLGKWVVKGGEQDDATFDFRSDGSMVGRVNLGGMEGIIKARVRVEGNKLLSVTRNPYTEKDETHTLIIKTLNARDLILQDDRGQVIYTLKRVQE
jgi:uncharacterized protein (TIGR03066 family)